MILAPLALTNTAKIAHVRDPAPVDEGRHGSPIGEMLDSMTSRITTRTLDTGRPFTRQQALAAGITDGQLRSRAYRTLHTGIYLAASVEQTALIRAQAATLPFGERAIASHATAARVWGLPIPTLPDEHVTVLDKAARRRRPGIRCHYARRQQVRVLDGVAVSSPAQTFVDLAGLLSLVDLVVVGDHLVRRKLVSLRTLHEFCEGSAHPHAAAARAAVAYVRERVDSPMETRLRMLIVLAGLPEPRVNPLVGDDDGLVMRRYDLCWPEIKLIVEYDGRHHVERIEQWTSDVARREAIDDRGWRIIVVLSDDIYKTPGATLARIHRALRARRLVGVPARLAEAWRPHFPGRG